MHNKLLITFQTVLLALASFHQNDKQPAFCLPNTQLETAIKCLLSQFALIKRRHFRGMASMLSFRTNTQD